MSNSYLIQAIRLNQIIPEEINTASYQNFISPVSRYMYCPKSLNQARISQAYKIVGCV